MHPWEKLLRLAEQLPRDSRYKASLFDDDEVVAEWVALHGVPADDAPRVPLTLEGWTPERDALVSLIEAVNAMHRTLIAVNNKGKAPDVRPLPRPKTAWDRLDRLRNFAEAQQLVALFSSPEDPPDLAVDDE